MTDGEIQKVIEAQGGLETYWEYMMPRLRALVTMAQQDRDKEWREAFEKGFSEGKP